MSNHNKTLAARRRSLLASLFSVLAVWLSLQQLVIAGAKLGANKCTPSGWPPRLSGSRTLYEAARKYLEAGKDLLSDYTNESLAEMDSRLIQEGCQPVAMQLLARHGARTPSPQQTYKWNKALRRLQHRLVEVGPGEGETCAQAVVGWKPVFECSQDELLTLGGQIEEADIARRLAKVYPEFFKPEQTRLGRPRPETEQLKVTMKVRTSQTALAFAQAIDREDLIACSPAMVAQVPHNDVEAPNYDPYAVEEDACYKSMRKHQLDELLRPQLKCKRFPEDSSANKRLVKRALEALVNHVGPRVAQRLGLEAKEIDWPILNAIVALCEHEVALKPERSSILCSLLDERDRQAYEYYRDLNTYLMRVHGCPSAAPQACPLVEELTRRLVADLELERGRKPRLRLGFYHAGSIKRLLAALRLFRDENSFTRQAVARFERTGEPPSGRSWRTSLAIPFSATQAFVLYRCAAGAPNRLLVAWNERAVKLAGCGGRGWCTVDEFLAATSRFTDCDRLPGCGVQPK